MVIGSLESLPVEILLWLIACVVIAVSLRGGASKVRNEAILGATIALLVALVADSGVLSPLPLQVSMFQVWTLSLAVMLFIFYRLRRPLAILPFGLGVAILYLSSIWPSYWTVGAAYVVMLAALIYALRGTTANSAKRV